MKQKFDIKKPNNLNWFFNIRRIDTSYTDYDESFPHQHAYYQFLFFDHALGTHLIDDKMYQIEKKSIHFVSPHHLHHINLTEGSTGYVCMFKEELFFVHNESTKFLDEIDLFSNWNKKPIIQVNDADFAELNVILDALKSGRSKMAVT